MGHDNGHLWLRISRWASAWSVSGKPRPKETDKRAAAKAAGTAGACTCKGHGELLQESNAPGVGVDDVLALLRWASCTSVTGKHDDLDRAGESREPDCTIRSALEETMRRNSFEHDENAGRES